MDFLSFASSHGLIIRSLEVGRWVRVPTVDHPKKKNGAYFYARDYGHVQNWAQMAECVSWRDNREYSPEQRIKLAEKMEASRQQMARERLRMQQEAAKKAWTIIAQAKIEQHAYLDAKGFPEARGLVWYPEEGINLLVIPMSAGGETVGCQLIDRDGGKKFLRGQRTSGAEFVFGSSGQDIWCEGYATARSIHSVLSAMKIKSRIHACFSAGNLERMASRGVIVADNDASGTGEKAAQKTGLPYFIPSEVGHDFNDLHKARGTFAAGMELRRFLQQARNGARPEPVAQETEAARA